MNKNEYYLLMENNSNIELIYDNLDFGLSRELNYYEPIDLPEEFAPLELHLRNRVAKPRIEDYHTLFGLEHVVSVKLKQAIEELKPVNLQFLPAEIHTRSDEYEDYFIVNCYNLIPAMDKEKSKWTKSNHPDPEREVQSIDKLVMDLDKLKDIPLSERLIFVLGECPAYTLFHESVIRNIEKADPKGLYAVPVEAWYADLMMDL